MNKLTRTTEVFQWTEAEQDAFDKLSTKLIEKPSLALPDFNNPFISYTGARFVGLGEALHQKPVMNERELKVPCCFISRALHNAELRYGATQLAS